LLTTALIKLGAVAATLTAGLSGPAIAIAALVAVVIGAIEYFNLWGEVIGFLIAVWNGLVEIIEFVVNWAIILSKAIMLLNPVTLTLIAIFGDLGSAIEWIGGILQWAWNLLKGFISWAAKWLGPIADAIGEVIGKIEEAVDKAGGADLSGAKIERGGASDRKSEQAAREDTRGRASEAVRERMDTARQQENNYNFDFSGSTFGEGMSERDIEKAVQRALAKQEQRTSDT
jgi:hypothetical protein